MSQEQEALRQVVRDIVRGTASSDEAASAAQLWEQLRELELAGVGIEEERGGSGGSLDQLLTIVEELALAGVRTPLVEHSAALWAAGLVGDRIAVAEGRLDPVGGVVTATLRDVSHASGADALVVLGTEGTAWVVDLAGETVELATTTNVAGVPISDVRLSGTAVRVLDAPDGARDRLEILRLVDLLGAAGGAYELTKDYLAQREQFGAPLISIPSIQLRLADLRVDLIEADHAVQRAVSAHDAGLGPGASVTRFALLAARLAVAKLCTSAWLTSHQLHGAIGTTEEYPLHRYTLHLATARDLGTSEAAAVRGLGELVLAEGEEALWTQFTSVIPATTGSPAPGGTA